MAQLDIMIADVAKACGAGCVPKMGIDNASEADYMVQITAEEVEFVEQLNKEDKRVYSYYEKQSTGKNT
jgi:hypothetical protein